MTLHVYDDLEQRSPEWFAARAGIVTASVVGKLIATGAPDADTVGCPTCQAKAGDPCLSKASKKPTPIKTFHHARTAKAESLPPVIEVADNDTSRGVIAGLVAERITGDVDQTYVSDDMWRGIEHEPYARDYYSGHYQQAVECGFIVERNDDWTLGVSPDGLVADEGGVEVKCPRAKTHVRTILADKVPDVHVPQIQAALLVTGRKWWDFVSFCAGQPLFVKRVYPDPAWHAAIVAACRKFETTAAEMVAAYTEKTKNLPATERIPDLDELVF